MSPQSASAQETIERAYRVRLYPKPDQARMLNRVFGARRFIWNWALARKNDAYRADGTKLGWVELSREYTELRCAQETVWLADLPREPFNQTLRDFDRAWKNFFAGRASRPRRRRFGTVQSARFTLDQRRIDAMVDREAGRLMLPRIGNVKFRVTEVMAGRLRSVTISRDAASRWFAAFTADGAPAPARLSAGRQALGIDLGLKHLAVGSDGSREAPSKHLSTKQKRLRRYQRRYVRQRDAALRRIGHDPKRPIPKGTKIPVSNRMRRTKRQVGTLHARIADARRNQQHQFTARACRSAEILCLEDLDVKAMGRSMGRRAFRRSVADASLAEVRRQISYKARWSGKIVSLVGRWYPSSKTCSGCGHVHRELELKDRAWACPACGTEHDRDANAAKNIEREGLRLLAQATAPDGDTRRSREINARGVDACAAGKSSLVGLPTTENRELAYRRAKPGTTRQSRDEPAQRVEG